MKTQNNKILLFVLMGIAASIVGLTQRLYPLRHNIPHDIEEKATILVIQNIRKSVDQHIHQSYPTLSSTEKQRIAKQQLDQIIRQDKDKVHETIAQVTKKLSQNISPGNFPFYLLASDSYYYYNLTENILETGIMGKKVRGSKYFNALMNAPFGYWEPLNLYPYVGFGIFQVASFLNPGLSLMEGVSYTPLVMTVFIIFVFLAGCSIIGCRPWASFLGIIYLLCTPIFLRRSMFGWYDDDPANILFLFSILAVFFYGLKNLSHPRISRYCAITLAFLFALYSLFWHGWVFMACLILLSSLIIGVYTYTLVRRNHIHSGQFRQLLIFLGLSVTGTFIAVSFIFGPNDFFALFLEGWTALQDFINPQLSLWPDLYIAVGELIPPTPDQWLTMLGGIFFIGIGIVGLVSCVISLLRKPYSADQFPLIVLILFWLITVKLSFGAQRFETLCLVPFAFVFSLGLQLLGDNARRLFEKMFPRLRWPPAVSAGVLIFLVLGLSVFPINKAHKKTPELLNRIFNSTWDRALTHIKNDTPANSIINTWWPPGHFIKAVAQRQVSFDGATINKPQSYWIANALLATDEHKAAGILRMLNTSGMDATDYLLKTGLPLSEATELLNTIIGLNKDAARFVLLKSLGAKTIEPLLELTHGQPPPTYLLIYKDMAEQSLQLSFVGNWDFKKVELIKNNPELRSTIPKRGSQDYIPFLWKLSGGIPHYSEILMPVTEKGNTIQFDQDVFIDPVAMTCSLDSKKFGHGIPHSLFYFSTTGEKGNYQEKKLPNATLPLSVFVFADGRNSRSMVSDPQLGRSMLFRLYYGKGAGLNIFEPFLQERDETGRTTILVFKINWDHLD